MRTRFKDWISIIEAGYDLNGYDQQWLTQLRNKAERLIDRGLWPSMMTYRYSPTSVDIEHCAVNGPGNLVQWAKQSTKQPQDALGSLSMKISCF